MSDHSKSYYEIQLDNKWLIALFVVLVIIVGLFFIWGMKVGKDTAELENEIKQIDNKMADKTITDVDLTDSSSQWTGDKTRDDFKQYDLDTSSKDKKKNVEKEDLYKSKKDNALVQSDKSEILPKKKSVQKTSSPLLKTEKQNEIDENRENNISDGNYLIQVLSIQEKDKADYYVKVLQDSGYPSFLTSIEIGNQGYFYRVRVGGYSTKEEAQNIVKKLLAEDRLKPILEGKKNLLILKQ